VGFGILLSHATKLDNVTHLIRTVVFVSLPDCFLTKTTNVEFHFTFLFIVGVVITLPQRVIAAEGKLDFVKEKGEHKLDLSFWLDKKREPDNKAGVYLLVAANPTKDGTTLQGEVKLSHPALQKVMNKNCM
jgi:hypothetical protein